MSKRRHCPELPLTSDVTRIPLRFLCLNFFTWNMGSPGPILWFGCELHKQVVLGAPDSPWRMAGTLKEAATRNLIVRHLGGKAEIRLGGAGGFPSAPRLGMGPGCRHVWGVTAGRGVKPGGLGGGVLGTGAMGWVLDLYVGLLFSGTDRGWCHSFRMIVNYL